jgi:hypothetical protein
MRKKKVRKTGFLSRVQKSPKIKAVRNKIKKQKLVLKRLSTQYKKTLKSESRRLAR